MQGGPIRGRSPITGPALLPAAQASQTPPGRRKIAPEGRKIQSFQCELKFSCYLGIPTPPDGGISHPTGSKI